MSINWLNPRERISKHFIVAEVTQNDSRRVPISKSFEEKNILFIAKKLDVIRDIWGSAIGVTSWYRPPRVNAEVGGVPNSQHIKGSAVDIFNHYGDPLEFENFLDEQWNDRHLGYGVLSGRGFTHLDLRLGRVRWEY